MNTNLTLVLAKKEELKIINDLMYRSKAYWGYNDNFMCKFMGIFQLTEHYIEANTTFLLYKDNNLIGFYSMSTTLDDQLELDNFFISEEHIGKGFGKILWGHVINTVKNLNKGEFIIWSDPYAEEFYKKMECIKIGTKESPMIPNRYPAIFKYII